MSENADHPGGQHGHRTSHASTGTMLALGSGLLVVSLLGKAMTAASEEARVGLSFATVVVLWAGVCLYLIHRRWAKRFEEQQARRREWLDR